MSNCIVGEMRRVLLGLCGSGIFKVVRCSILGDGATPAMEVDPETYEVRADGRLLTCEPATELALAQRYFLF